MFHNYFFLRHLADELDDRLKDSTLVECFTQQKDELILGFDLKDSSDLYIKASLGNEVNLLAFQEDFSRARKNSVDLFSQLIDRTVKSVDTINFDRSFLIEFSGSAFLLFKLHGNRSNVVLLHEKGENELFKSKLRNDTKLSLNDIRKDLYIGSDMSESDISLLIKIAGRETQTYLNSVFQFEQQDQKGKADLLVRLLKQFEQKEFHIIEDGKPSLYLFTDKTSSFSTSSAIEAANVLYRKTVSGFLFRKERDTLLQSLRQKIKKSENYIRKNEQKLKEIAERRSYEEIANIIMANLHIIPDNASKATVNDVYTGKPMEVKLKRNLSPQKNAEQYYRKAKNEKIEKRKLQENISEKENLITGLHREIGHVENLTSYRDLRKYMGKHQDIDSKQEKGLPYKTFHYQGYEIRVGKNAAANDQLTLRYAHKEDIWLHARDVAGSHVILRSKKSKVPNPVLEYAAGLAAYYSKRKNDTLCPVIYTPRKYIRKGKGMAAGSVRVEKEEVVLVPPTSPNF